MAAIISMEPTPPARTIDEFLKELHQEYRRRLPNGTSSRSAAICQYRHYLPLPLLALCIANSSDATEILMLSYLLANSSFRRDMFTDNSNGENSSMEGAEYLAASIFLGMLLGGTLFGFLSDHIGRRPALLAGLSINATAGLLSSFKFLTPTIAQLTMWRFLAGIGVGATVPSIFSMASEWSPKEVRGAMVTLVASFWMVGSLFVSGLAWILFRGDVIAEQNNGQDHNSALPIWRIFAALCAIPSALAALMVYCYVPESPRFYQVLQNYDQTAHVCNQMAKSLKSVNSKPLTREELQQNNAPNLTPHSDAIQSTWQDRVFQTYHQLFQTLQRLYSPQLLTRTTLPLQTIWFALSFSTYGITTWINTLFVSIHLQNIYFNSFLFALSNLPGNAISLMYSDKLGRKRMLIGSLLGAAAGLAGFAMLAYWGDRKSVV